MLMGNKNTVEEQALFKWKVGPGEEYPRYNLILRSLGQALVETARWTFILWGVWIGFQMSSGWQPVTPNWENSVITLFMYLPYLVTPPIFVSEFRGALRETRKKHAHIPSGDLYLDGLNPHPYQSNEWYVYESLKQQVLIKEELKKIAGK